MEINKTKKKTIKDIIIFIICLIIACVLIYYHRIKYLLFITRRYKTINIAIFILIPIITVIYVCYRYKKYKKYKKKFSE
jgi:amino acid transporter